MHSTFLSVFLVTSTAVLSSLLAGEPVPAPPEPARGALTAADAARQVREVSPDVEAIRELTFKRPVATKIIGDAAAREYAIGRFRKFTTADKSRAEQEAYRVLGLLPPGTDVLSEYLKVLEEQAGGFYDPSSKVLYLLDDMPAAIGPFLASHELAHALEDQYFDLDRRLKEAGDDDDLTFARSAVHEGSATLVMSVYGARAMQDGTVRPGDLKALADSDAGRAVKLGAMPPVLRRQLLGVYLLGASFLVRGDAGSLANGYPVGRAERAYRDGPRSSEQILHPEKFWEAGARDEPKPVSLADLGSILGAGWKREASGKLGELTLGVLVGAPTPSGRMAETLPIAEEWTNQAAAGWGGDRWELWTQGTSSLVVLKTIWDTPADADEFAAALPARSGLAWKREGNRVGIVAGEPGDRLPDLLSHLVKE